MTEKTEKISTEIKIPVPWGHIAGKCWNRESEEHILFVHGVQHNCNAFNRLIRLLKTNSNIVAIDLPSHGQSSHFPPGSPLNLTEFVLAVKRVIDHLQWKQFSYIGHSFGGQIGTYLSAIFAEHVKRLIVIDTMEPRPVPIEETFSYLQTIMKQQLTLEHKLLNSSPPIYTHEEAFVKVKKNGNWPLSDEATYDLMERTVIKFKDGFTFTSDQRLKYPMRPILTFEQQREIVKNISCPVLFIIAKGNTDRYKTYLKQMYEFNSARDNVTILLVEGDHAVHQNHPERLNVIIDAFLVNERLQSNHDVSLLQSMTVSIKI